MAKDCLQKHNTPPQMFDKMMSLVSKNFESEHFRMMVSEADDTFVKQLRDHANKVHSERKKVCRTLRKTVYSPRREVFDEYTVDLLAKIPDTVKQGKTLRNKLDCVMLNIDKIYGTTIRIYKSGDVFNQLTLSVRGRLEGVAEDTDSFVSFVEELIFSKIVLDTLEWIVEERSA